MLSLIACAPEFSQKLMVRGYSGFDLSLSSLWWPNGKLNFKALTATSRQGQLDFKHHKSVSKYMIRKYEERRNISNEEKWFYKKYFI